MKYFLPILAVIKTGLVKLEYQNCSRRDFSSYAILLVGLIFTWAGITTDPAYNCDESGLDCEPWLVYVGLCLGVFATVSGLYLIIKNYKCGSEFDVQQHLLTWWDTRSSSSVHSISIKEVSRIKVRINDGCDNVFLYDRFGDLMPFQKEYIFPHPGEDWARGIAARYTHIVVDVEKRG